MADLNSIKLTDRDVFDELWRVCYAMSGVLVGARSLAEGALSDHSTPEDRDALAGVLEALERLAADGERLAAAARDKSEEAPALVA